MLKSDVYLGWKVHMIFLNIFDSLSCRYKWLCQFYLFEQRNLHRPNQWLQLQLPSRIYRQPMRHWLDSCCCYFPCISGKTQHETPNVGRCWMLMADKYGSILNPTWILHHPTMLMMLYLQDKFLSRGSRVHWIDFLQFYWPRIPLGPRKCRKENYAVKITPRKSWFLFLFLFAIGLWLLFPLDINECESRPCLNNGTCTDRINAFNCSCQPGFSSNRCEIG